MDEREGATARRCEEAQPPSRRLDLLVIGVDSAAVATSAHRVGHTVYAVDYFGDLDLATACRASLSVIEQAAHASCGRVATDFDPSRLVALMDALATRHHLDAALLTSGLEDQPEALAAIDARVPILGNRPAQIAAVRDAARFFDELARRGVPHPRTAVVTTEAAALAAAREIGYPVVLKPEKRFGGTSLRRVARTTQLRAAYREVHAIGGRMLVQPYLRGTPASVSTISTAGRAMALTVNEQLLGLPRLAPPTPFTYCGNVVPLSAPDGVVARCRRAAETVVTAFELVGSNGVDFVITEEGAPLVVEVNPRFQGSLACVEAVLGINLVAAHLAAVTRGALPTAVRTTGSCARLILYAPRRVQVGALARVPGVRDVPHPGAVIEAGEPVCSVVARGASRAAALRRASRTAAAVRATLRPAG
jgi:predicted ATP-grasp superfamily ATP-dependent carboligase